MMAVQFRTDPEYPDALKVFGSSEFWVELSSAETIIRPLSNASFKLQRDENSLADVLISMKEIAQGFSKSTLEYDLVKLVETRWLACEQPLIMLVFFLHPKYVEQARNLPETQVTAVDRICGIAV